MNLLCGCLVIMLLSLTMASSEKLVTKNIDVDDIREECHAPCTVYVSFCVSAVTELCSYERVETFTWKEEVPKRSIQLTFSYNATEERILRIQVAQPKYSRLYLMKETAVLKQINMSLEQDTKTQTEMAQIEDQNSRIAQLENITDMLLTYMVIFKLSPFKLPPSEKMITTIKKYTHNGLSPILSDRFGRYETIDWNKLGGNLNWIDQWMKVKRKEGGGLFSPPLIVPREYGECVIVLWIGWENNQLEMDGYIPPFAAKWIPLPESISIDAQITIFTNGSVIKTERRLFQFLKYDWSTLIVINETMNELWNLPTVDVRVFPLI